LLWCENTLKEIKSDTTQISIKRN